MDNLQNIQQILEEIDDNICNVKISIQKIIEAKNENKNKDKDIYYTSQLENLNRIHTNLIDSRKYYFELYHYELLRKCCGCSKCKNINIKIED